jgi:hypothetical protein
MIEEPVPERDDIMALGPEGAWLFKNTINRKPRDTARPAGINILFEKISSITPATGFPSA